MAATSPVSAMAPERKKKRYRQDIVKENIEVWLMMLPVLVIIFIFSYIPLWGVIIAFQDYQPGSPSLIPRTGWALSTSTNLSTAYISSACW